MILLNVARARLEEYPYRRVYIYKGIPYFKKSTLKALYKIAAFTGDFYIGSSSTPFTDFYWCKKDMDSGMYENGWLQNLYDNYGKDSVTFEIYEVLPSDFTKEQMVERMNEVIKELKPSLNRQVL